MTSMSQGGSNGAADQVHVKVKMVWRWMRVMDREDVGVRRICEKGGLATWFIADHWPTIRSLPSPPGHLVQAVDTGIRMHATGHGRWITLRGRPCCLVDSLITEHSPPIVLSLSHGTSGVTALRSDSARRSNGTLPKVHSQEGGYMQTRVSMQQVDNTTRW